ncbi:MAG: hypothetical protein O3A13_16490 [Proteobacteria bacterium]|nr:hypothetical protein [Pseudomonadota bacterium]
MSLSSVDFADSLVWLDAQAKSHVAVIIKLIVFLKIIYLCLVAINIPDL